MSDNKSEREKIMEMGRFGMYHKPLAQEIGLNAAVILDFLIYKYDYFVQKEKKFLSYGKYKAFFVTYQDIEDATTIKVNMLSRNKSTNPLVILEKYKLIKRKMEYHNFKKIYYYILFFDNIHIAFNLSLQKLEKKKLEKKKLEDKWEKKIKETRNKKISNFLEVIGIPLEVVFKTNEIKILQNGSMGDVKMTDSGMSNNHIMENKIIKKSNHGERTNQKRTNQKNREKDDENDEVLFQDENSEIHKQPRNDSFPVVDPQLLFRAINETRLEVMSTQDFFDFITGGFLKEKFKGFKMSTQDELLIYEMIINNPMFIFENEDIEERDYAILDLKKNNKNISLEEINEELDFDEHRYEHLYNHLWEKIFENCKRINQGELKARFGNIFVGVREFSKNYTLNMVRN